MRETSMTPKQIKDLRTALKLTQEELAQILGTTKTSVARYEMERGGSRPQGDVKNKLDQLYSFITNVEPGEKEQVQQIRNTGIGGLASLAAILTIGAFIFPVSAAVSGIRLSAILASPAAKILGSLLVASGVAVAVKAVNKTDTKEEI